MQSIGSPGPATPLFKRNTASSLLAKFSPSHTHHKMAAKPGTTSQLSSPKPAMAPTDLQLLNGSQQAQHAVIDLVDHNNENSEDDAVIYASSAQRKRSVRAAAAVLGQIKQPVSYVARISRFKAD